jgi:hypothetical protein
MRGRRPEAGGSLGQQPRPHQSVIDLAKVTHSYFSGFFCFSNGITDLLLFGIVSRP